MKIQSVAILGAGAVGSYIIWGLSKKDTIRLGVIAEGDRARRLKESGCAINGAVYRPEVWTPQEAQGVDLLVVALKYGSLPGALESIKTAVGSNTVVMSLMNGVDSEELIAAQVGAEHLLYSFIKVASHKEADGYHFDPDATLGVIYGERFAPFESERVKAVRELFTDSGVNFRVTEQKKLLKSKTPPPGRRERGETQRMKLVMGRRGFSGWVMPFALPSSMHLSSQAMLRPSSRITAQPSSSSSTCSGLEPWTMGQ